MLTSLNGVPIIVERAMYSSAAGTFAAGHDSAGVTSPSLDWFFAEGATGSFFDTFLLLANPGASAANVHATYLLPSGQTVQKDYVVPANSRRTLNVQLEDPQLAATSVSTRLTSTNGVAFLAERSMWWPHGQAWFEAHNAAGATTTGTKWGVGDGEVGLLPEDTATFLLIANTSSFAGTVRVTLLFETGAPITQDFALPANARFNVPVLSTEAPASADLHAGAARDAVQRGGREPRRDAAADRRRARDVLERQRPVLGRGLGFAGDEAAVTSASTPSGSAAGSALWELVVARR